MKNQKSIVSCSTSLQRQLLELLEDPCLIGRIILGLTQDFEWQQLKCLVPLYSPFNRINEWTTITAIVRLNSEMPESTPGLYIQSNFLTPQSKFINVTEDLQWLECDLSLKDLIGRVLSQIDCKGFLQWAHKTYFAHISQYNIHVQQVNLKLDNINNLANNQNINQINGCLKSESACQQRNFNNLESMTQLKPHRSSAFSFTCNQKLQNKIKKQPLLQNIGIENCSESKQNSEDASKQCIQQQQKDAKIQVEKTNGDDSNRHPHKNISLQFHEANKIFRNPFSCFRPFTQISSFTPIKGRKIQQANVLIRNYEKCQKTNQDFLKLRGSNFVPYSSSSKDKSKDKNLPANAQKYENIINVKIEQVSQQQADREIVCEAVEKKAKHPKPMNKNANLPKFLIRIFIKYVDKFKSMYVKREYDRLYSQCRKMKQWKKNDRRQHAFGLKHLKIFFQDAVEGYPDPALNRKVISKIIDNFLLEQICQNSQIPQSHRVGYLVACRVYSMRCRNVSLAGRIQSK